MDRLLSACEKGRRIVREIHPEAFSWALARGSPMRQDRKTPAGVDERLLLLDGLCPSVVRDFFQIRREFRRRDMANDDSLDALAAAITASADPRTRSTLPALPGTDSVGLPMEIVGARQAWGNSGAPTHAYRR
ncbi:MAG: DUF429 domain-containing protein [Bryobacterales bacterium]|nr:DUF429 domain-containing protein [Bryobacterales bacterium]